MMRRALAMVILAGASPVWAAAADSLSEKQQEARQQQSELRTRIKRLQAEIERQEGSRRDAAVALKDSEAAISDISRRLAGLRTQTRQAGEDLDALARQTQQQQTVLDNRRHALARHLKAQYSSGLSPWTALLSGDDPRLIGRDLSYLGYVSAAQAQAVREVQAALDQLQALQARTHEKQAHLNQLAQQTAEREAELQAQREERQGVLQRIDAELREQRNQAQRLEDNEARLGRLIDELQAEIARAAEQARIAEEKRRAEARRQAEEARLAAEARQRALEQEREKERQAEQAARVAQEQAQRERLQQDAARARMQVERARAEAEEADRAAAKHRAEAASLRGEVPAAGKPGAMAGLHKNLPHPVPGAMQGRFGGQRPEGGIWRGVVLRAAEGAHVRTVASGQVAFASWLSGFGNIIIVDHGKEYLSVYAYNQSLLKEVGDPVGAGDVIATVGATGGQVEPGLYFEIRYQGKPVNPQLWLKP